MGTFYIEWDWLLTNSLPTENICKCGILYFYLFGGPKVLQFLQHVPSRKKIEGTLDINKGARTSRKP